MLRLRITLASLALGAVLTVPTLAFAQEANFPIPDLQIRIPGIDKVLTDAVTTDCPENFQNDSTDYCLAFPWIGQYISSLYIWACLIVTLGFGAIGFLDDHDKVTKASHKGLSARMRLLAEFAIAGLATWLIVSRNGTLLYLPFWSGGALDLSYAYYIFGAFVIVAFGNAVNLTDGLDGLASMPVIIACMAFMAFAYLVGRADYAAYLGIPHVPGAGDLIILCGAIIGACLAFLWFNAPPAAVFMGDTGSLALGGALGAIAVSTRHEIVLGIVGGLFVAEAMSVISQVLVYKRTGKRVFRMAPIHHHFEQKGWSEPTVVIRFWIVSFVLALAGLATLKLR